MSTDQLTELRKSLDRYRTDIAVIESEQKKRLSTIQEEFEIEDIEDIEDKLKELTKKRKKNIKRRDSIREKAENILGKI